MGNGIDLIQRLYQHQVQGASAARAEQNQARGTRLETSSEKRGKTHEVGRDGDGAGMEGVRRLGCNGRLEGKASST